MNTTNGIIAERSKETIASAMLEVMKIYSYDEITVTQITQEAKLSRKTFYRHFNDKEQVLKHLFDSLYQECVEEIVRSGLSHYWDVVQCYFDFWEKHADVIKLMKKSGLLPVLFEESYNRSFEVFKIVRTPDIAKANEAGLPYMLSYSIGGMQSMLMRWIENDMAVESKMIIDCLKNSFRSDLI
ncbi:MAG: TetR family transcriptional regulator [Clostridiales bacterium]|nr:TetR family transcriptional regulator [Clostridiales bacterium]